MKKAGKLIGVGSLLACFAVLGLGGVAWGAPGIELQVISNGQVGTCSADGQVLWSYTIQALGVDGANPSAVGGAIYGSPVGSASLHQRWLFEVVPTPTMTNVALLPLADQVVDTHYLHTDAEILAGITPTEDQSMHYGTLLSGDFAVKPAYVSNPLPIAQVVGPSGSYFTLEDMTVASPETGIVQFSGPEYVIEFLPEPASMVLLCIGSLAVLRRRRL